MSLLLNGDCLELMKDIEADSVDLIFCDLPYGQTSCKWDCKIDLDKFWLEVMRIKKLNTPIFFTTTKSPSSICGVKVVLFLPLIIFDITVANLPTTAFLASISYQLDDN